MSEPLPPRRRVRVRPDAGVGSVPVDPSAIPAPAASRGGYCDPPVEHQFKPGHSGNPKGRPRGSRNRATMVADALSLRIRTKIDGKSQRLLPMEALIHVILHKALGGDRHAWETVLRWDDEAEASKAKREALQSFTEKEQAIFQRMQERFGRRSASK